MNYIQIKQFKIIAFTLVLLLNVACRSSELNKSLELSGENRSELEKVLNHYANLDPLKYKAACFLIENMKWHFNTKEIVEYDKKIDEFALRADSIYYSLFTSQPDSLLNSKHFMDSLKLRDTPFREMVEAYMFEKPIVNDTYVNDLHFISADFLIRHIDNAFLFLGKTNIVPELSFEDFCEYILPYRSLQNYNCVQSGDELSRIFSKYIYSHPTANVNTYIERYNSSVSRLRWFLGQYPFENNIGVNELFFRGFHDCVDIAAYGTSVFRANGMPVAIEFNSAYKVFEGRHYHSSVRDSAGRWCTFSPESSLPMYRDPKFQKDGIMNVYRHYFSAQPDAAFFLKNEDEFVPALLSSPCIKDVTSNIVATVQLRLDFDSSTTNNLAYLATFSRSGEGFIPVTWGEIKRWRKKVVFKNIIPDRLYFPIYYDDREAKVFGDVFFLKADTTVSLGYKIIKFNNTTNKVFRTINIGRKFPVKETMKTLAKELVGTVVLGSNDKQFLTYDTLGIICTPPKPYYQDIKLNTAEPYLYYRVKTTDKHPHANISEIEFLTDASFGYKNITKATELAFVSSGDKSSSDCNLVRLLDEPLEEITWKSEYDGNVETAPSAYQTINFRLQEPQLVTHIRYVPKNANNGVEVGDSYVLKQWNGKAWTTNSHITANDVYLSFSGLQTKTLYWLQNITKGKEEMPFVIDNHGKQCFIYSEEFDGLINNGYFE
jgi:hypothetical protein